MAEEDIPVTQADVESLAEKLEAWSPSLTDNEREILGAVVRKAAEGADDDVVGFAMSFGSPLASALGQGINLTPKGATLPGVGKGGFPNLNPGSIRAKNSEMPNPGS